MIWASKLQASNMSPMLFVYENAGTVHVRFSIVIVLYFTAAIFILSPLFYLDQACPFQQISLTELLPSLPPSNLILPPHHRRALFPTSASPSTLPSEPPAKSEARCKTHKQGTPATPCLPKRCVLQHPPRALSLSLSREKRIGSCEEHGQEECRKK